jgi:anti-sigma B factor antagonist
MPSELAVDHEITRDRDMNAEAMVAAISFRVDVAREGDAVRVSPVGDVDLATIDQLRERLDDAMESGAGRVILDLRAATFIDSSTLHLAVDAYGRAMRTGIDFAMVAGPPGVQRTFDVAGLSDRLPFVDVPRGQLR